MTQQTYQPEAQVAQQAGQTGSMEQFGGTGQVGGGQTSGLRLQDVQTPQEGAVLDAIAWSVEVCGWCADQCIQLGDPNMTECIRLCEDVTELGETALALLPRRSRHAQTVLQAFEQAAQACAQECSHHQHAHCQECAEALGTAVSSIQQFAGQGGQQAGQQSARQPGQQMGQQSIQPTGSY